MLCSALLCLRRPAWRHCPAATGALHNKDGDELPVSALCLAFQRAREAVTAVTAITFRRRTASCAMSGSAQVSQARSNQSLLPEQKAALLALPSETAVSAHARRHHTTPTSNRGRVPLRQSSIDRNSNTCTSPGCPRPASLLSNRFLSPAVIV